jgi:hypothetical protein
MAGRITFKSGIDQSVIGSIVEPVTLSNTDRKRIENILSRELTDEDIAMLCSGLEFIYHLQHMNDDSPTSQDSKESLKAIDRETDEYEVLRAYDGGNGPDSQTSPMLLRQLHKMGFKSFDDVPAESIREAARAILANFPTAINGRPQEIWRPYFAQFATSAWAKLGRRDKAYVDSASEQPSPFLGFAIALCASITRNGNSVLSADAVLKILKPRKAVGS